MSRQGCFDEMFITTFSDNNMEYIAWLYTLPTLQDPDSYSIMDLSLKGLVFVGIEMTVG